jgi:hypothetical protein
MREEGYDRLMHRGCEFWELSLRARCSERVLAKRLDVTSTLSAGVSA